MDRDDQLLRGIADGATSPAALEERTGLTHATVWRGLHRLEESGHVFSPARSVYRLSALGQTALSLPRQEPAMPQPADGAPDVEPRSTSAMDGSVLQARPRHPVERDAATDHHDGDRQAQPGVVAGAIATRTFGWGQLVAVILVFLGVVVVVVGIVRIVGIVLADRGAAGPAPVLGDAPPQPASYLPPWANWG